MAETNHTLYPHLVVANNKNPNKLFAFPFIGIVIKVILLLPILLELFLLLLVSLFVISINWFVISFTGKYWTSAYTFFLGLMRLGAKVKLYIWGITDTYPGFTFDTKGLFELDIPKPEKPNKWLAIPFVGIAIRAILLIPYSVFDDVLDRASGIAMVISWFAITFKRKFPESLYEFEKDTLRVSLASSSYLLGLSDKYPSFSISMNHQTIKLLLIIAGALLVGMNFSERLDSMNEREPSRQQVELKYQSDHTPSLDENLDYKTY